MKSGTTVPRAVLTFALLGLVVLALVGLSGTIVLRRLATDQALDQARASTRLASKIVERRVTQGLLTGDARATADVASVVTGFVLPGAGNPVVRVKIWDADGQIVYSDKPELIGESYPLGPEERDILLHGGVSAELSDLQKPENRFERSYGDLLEVYTPIHTKNGTPLLFETYQRFSSVANSEGEVIARFAPVLLVALVAFGLLEVPLAWVLARRVESAQMDRERFLQRALDASAHERRRIARDLHDGPVQELTGLAMQLSASAEGADEPSRAALRSAASAARASIRTLRSATVGIYPPNLRQAGLGPALSDLTARLQHEGMDVSLDVDATEGFSAEVDEILYRVCQEALRNVEAHASADHVAVRVRREGGSAVLEVDDDGRGLDPAAASNAAANGHMGLRMMAEVARDADGSLSVTEREGGGTVVRLEVPA